MKAPLSIICELTHRCPLRCVYCSNPLELTARALEMTTAEWASTMEQAAETWHSARALHGRRTIGSR